MNTRILIFSFLVICFFQESGFSQTEHEFETKELQIFFEIYKDSKNFTTQISEEEFKSIQLNLELSNEELKSFFQPSVSRNPDQVNPKKEKFLIELGIIKTRKAAEKIHEIQKLCGQKNFPYDTYQKILDLYSTNSEFQNIVCQTVN